MRRGCGVGATRGGGVRGPEGHKSILFPNQITAAGNSNQIKSHSSNKIKSRFDFQIIQNKILICFSKSYSLFNIGII